jgi:ATP synthase protein I
VAAAVRHSMRTVLRWQLLITALAGLLAWATLGPNGLLSALLGGAVSVLGGLVFFWAAQPSLRARAGAGAALTGVLRAEAIKIVVVVALLWVVLTRVPHVVPVIVVFTFVVAVLIQSLAMFVRDN